MKKKLKRYRLKINPDKNRVVDFISQVESPAIEVNFLKFNQEEQGNMDVFGYKTQYFEMCPVAQQVFGDLIKMPIDERNVGMVRSAAQIADSVFRIEKEVIENEMATSLQMNEVLLLVSDFKDVMDQLNAELNLKLDSSFMDAHIETVSKYLGENLKDFVEACWEGYEPVGFKILDGQRVPNCVPIKEEMKMKSESNDEKMELFGPVLIPDLPIYRYSEKMGEYEIIFKKEDIKEIAMNFMKSGYQKNVNLDHGEETADSYVFESFISDDLVANPKPYGDLPLGTWFVRMKVNDKKVWQDIKSGKRNGFSIEGMFEYITEELEKSYLKSQPTNLLNKKLNLEKMLKDLFKKIFTELSQELDETPASADLSDYTKVASSDYKIEAREVGSKVEVIDPQGNLVNAQDGAYELEDGFKFMVKDGLISEIDGVSEEPEMKPVETGKKKSYMDMLADYPWDQCMLDMADEGYDEETAKKICGSIRWENMEEVASEPKVESLQVNELIELKEQIENLKKDIITKEEIQKEITQIKEEFMSVFEKFTKLPAEPTKITKVGLAKELESQKFNAFLNTIRKQKN